MTKYKCPYCNYIFDDLPPAICPHCKKAMMIPDDLLRKAGRIKSTPKHRESREIKNTFPAFLLERKPSHILIILCIMILVGGLVISKARYLQIANSNPEKQIVIAQSDLNKLRIALELFKRQFNRYPSQEEGLKILTTPNELEGTGFWFIRRLVPDPWGTPYQYHVTNNTVLIWSAGPDKKSHTTDDIYPYIENLSNTVEIIIQQGIKEIEKKKEIRKQMGL